MAENMGALSVDVSLNIDTSVSKDELKEALKELEKEAITVKLKIDADQATQEVKGLVGLIDTLPNSLQNFIDALDKGMASVSETVARVSEQVTNLRDALSGAMDSAGSQGLGDLGLGGIVKSLDKVEQKTDEVRTSLKKVNNDNDGMGQVQQKTEQTAQSMERTAESIKEVGQISAESTKAVIANEKEKQAETDKTTAKIEKQAEAIKAESEASKAAKENWPAQTISQNFETDTKRQAQAQLKKAYKSFEKLDLGLFNETDLEKRYSQAGAIAGYNFVQAYQNALDWDVKQDVLEQYTPAAWLNARDTQKLNKKDYNSLVNQEITSWYDNLGGFQNYYNQVLRELQGAPITQEIKDQIANIQALQDHYYLTDDYTDEEAVESAKADLEKLVDAAKQGSNAIQEEAETAKELNETLAQAPESTQQVAEQAKETVANLREEKTVSDEAAQATTAAGEAAVNAENQEQASIEQTIRALNRKAHEAREALMIDYPTFDTFETRSNEKIAIDQLQNAYQKVHELGGDQGEDSFWELTGTQEGTAAAYVYLKAYTNAFNRETSSDAFVVPDLTVGQHDRLSRSGIDGYISNTWDEANHLAEIYEQRLQEIISLSDELGSYLHDHDLTPDMTEDLMKLQEYQDDIRKLGPGTVYDLTYTPEEIKEVENHLRELIQLESQIPETDLGTEQVSAQAEQTAEGVKQENAALQETAQQASSSAETVVEAENQKQAEAQETIAKLQEEAKAAQEVLSADYTAANTKDARNQLKATYAKVEELGGTQGVDSFYQLLGTEAGSAAAYTYLQAFQQAFEQHVGAATIKANTIPALQIGAVSDMFDDRVTGSNQRTRLQDWFSIVEDNLKGIITLSKELDQYTQNHELTPDMGNLIQELKELQDLSHTESSTNSTNSIINSDRLMDVKDQLMDLVYQENHALEENAQQASSSADTFVSEEERKRAAALETAKFLQQLAQQRALNQKQQEENWPQQLLHQNFDVRTKKQAEKQLKEAYASFESLDIDTLVQENGGLNARYSRAGASAGYAFQQAFNEACEHGVDEDIIDQYTPARLKELEDVTGYREIDSLIQNMQGFASLYKRVLEQLQGASITPEIEQQIAYIQSLNDKAWSLAKQELGSSQPSWVLENVQRAYADEEKEISEAERELDRLINAAKRASDSVQQDIQVTEELIQAEQAQGETGVAANQQVQTSAEGAAGGINEITEAEESLLAINIIPDTDSTQKLSDTAHSAAESMQELGESEEGLLNINIIPQVKDVEEVGEKAQESTEDVNGLSQATQDLTQTEQTLGEVGVEANQEVQSSAEGVAEEYKALAAAADEAVNAEKQAGSLAEETLNKDYTIKGKKNAGDNLKAAFEQIKAVRGQANEYGSIDGIYWENTEVGAAAGYELGQAYAQGIKNGVAESKLDRYFDNDWANRFLTTESFDLEDVSKALKNPEGYFTDSQNGLQQRIDGYKAILNDYVELRNQVLQELEGKPLTEGLEKDIALVVNARQQARHSQDLVNLGNQSGGASKYTLDDAAFSQRTLGTYERLLQSSTKEAASATEALEQMSEKGDSAVTSIEKVATAEEQIVATNISSEANELQQIGEAAQTTDEHLDEVKEHLQEIANTPVETVTPSETIKEVPQEQEDTGLKRTKEDIQAVIDAYNTLTKTEEEWQKINAIPPEDWTDKQVESLAGLKVQRDAANEVIAKATDLTSEEVAAQEKYGKKLAELEAKQKAQIDLEKQRAEAIEIRAKAEEEANAKAEQEKVIEPPPAPEPAPEPKQQEDTSLKQKKKDIDEITEAYNTLTKLEKQYRELSAMNPADMSSGQKKNWNSISVQYENAQAVIANISKETQLTEKQTQAQNKYNKKKQELDQIEQRAIETDKIAADTLAERQEKQEALVAEQERAAEAERAKAEAEQAEIDKANAEAAAIQEIIDAYAELEKLEPKHQQNQRILDSGKSLNGTQSKDEQKYAALKAKIDEAKVSTEEITAAEEHYQNVVKDSAAIWGYQTLTKDLAEYNNLIQKQSLGKDLTFPQQERLQQLTNEMTQAWNAIGRSVDGYKASTEEATTKQNAFKNAIADSHIVAENFAKSLGEPVKETFDNLADAQAKVEELFSNGKGGKLTWDGEQQAHGTATWGNELRKVQYTIQQIGDDQYQVYAAIKSSQTATTTWAGLIDSIGKRFQSLVSYAASFLSVYRLFSAARSGINTVTELNTQLTEMRKVTDESVESLKRYQDQTFAVAKEVGSTAAQIQSSTADYLRLGKSLDEAAELAKNTSILMSVSEFSSISDATEAMIAMNAAFKDMSSMEIIDELNKIGNNFSISTSDLAMGMQTAASTLTVAGNSFEQSLALMTAGNAVIQDYSKTATGLRTISLRIMGTKAAMEELEDMGEDVSDYEVTTTAKMAEQIEALTQVNGKKGVNILTDNGNLRSTYDILLDISKVWKQIREEDEVTGQNRQQALLEQLAGEVLPEYIEMCA